MKKILTLTIIFSLLVIPVVAQEKPKPLTPEQRIENLTNKLLNMKFNFAEEKSQAAKEKNFLAVEMKIVVQLQVKVMQLQKRLAALEESLKQANGKITQLTMKPKEVKGEKAPDNDVQERKGNKITKE